MAELYCVKCKSKTATLDLMQTKSKNNRDMLRGICAVCGTKKTQFIAATRGENLNSLINKLPLELHLPGHNFTGPGTNLKKRLRDPYGIPPDFTPQPWSKPINRVDEAAMHHDICYLQNEDKKTRNEVCDKKMLQNLNILNPTIRERIDKGIVGNIIKAKVALGMGVPFFPKRASNLAVI